MTVQTPELIQNFIVMHPEQNDAMSNPVCRFQQRTGEKRSVSWHGLYFNGVNYCEECGWSAETHDIPTNWIIAWR